MCGSIGRKRGSLPPRSVQTVPVVVPGELVEHPAELPLPDDEHVVQALPAHRAHPPFRERIRGGRARMSVGRIRAPSA